LQQAISEISGLGIDQSVIPLEIKEAEGKGYVFICVKSKDNQSGTGKVHAPRVLYAPIGKYDQMVKDIPRFKGLFNGMFNLVVILHDPTLPMPKKKKAKGLSPTHKSKVKEMLEEGKSAKEIAEALNVSIERVEAHLGL
jgi:hypothetical protein